MTISQFVFGAYLLIALVIIIFSVANKNTPLWREITIAVTWPLVFLTVIILLVYLPFYAQSMKKKDKKIKQEKAADEKVVIAKWD